MNRKEKSRPIISVLTPTWNRKNYLIKLVDSLKQQTFQNFEWIVANDGSTDQTDLFIKSISRKLNFNVIYINSSLRVGKSKLDNLLMDKISGQYFLWCDSDDTLLPDALKNLYNLASSTPEKDEQDFLGVIAQNVNENGTSQTFEKEKVPKNAQLLRYQQIKNLIKGDGTILLKSNPIKHKRFLEVDFLINESSLWEGVFDNMKFFLSPTIVKIMNRGAENSVSFGKKLLYCRGSAYCIATVETSDHFNKHSFISKLKIAINYWRYTIHGDLNYLDSKKMLEPIKKNFLYSFLYPFSYVIALRDRFLGKVEKTHIEFNVNIKKTKIKVEKFYLEA